MASAVRTIEGCGVRVLTLDDIVELGKRNPMPPSPPDPDDLAIIMYTSGTTGMPKGVKISHANVVATVAGLEDKMPTVGVTGEDDVYLAYMPLAHIMELAGELIAYSIGMQVGYGSPHTLTPTGVKLMPDTCLGDAQVCTRRASLSAPGGSGREGVAPYALSTLHSVHSPLRALTEPYATLRVPPTLSVRAPDTGVQANDAGDGARDPR